MKIVQKTLLLATAVAVFAVSALAGPPINSSYTGAQVLPGRFAESFAGPGQFLTAGNVMKDESWDANILALGTQYIFSCPELAGAVLQSSTVDGSGTGQEVWEKTFLNVNGTFFLNGTGEAWDGGDATYTGTIDSYTETITIIFFFFSRVAATSNIAGSGRFDLYGASCINWIANGADVSGIKNNTFPDYVDATCAPTRIDGRFGSRSTYTINITPCVVPVEESTWGAIKSLYNN